MTETFFKRSLVLVAAQAPDLRPREQEVLKMLVKGLDYPEMAEKLGVNSLTAKYHVGNVLLKLGAMTRSEAIDVALQRRLVS